MNFLKTIWLKSAFLFEPVQDIFNGNFWDVFAKKFRKYTEGRVLDLGCGTAEFRKHISPKSYLGLDVNKPYIVLNKNNFLDKKTHFEVFDIAKYKPWGKFDSAFLVSVAHHLSDRQLESVCSNVKKLEIKYLVIADGYPIWPFKKVLIYLDSFLGGGDYFRNENQVAKIATKQMKLIDKGNFSARRSLYTYPYVVLRK